MEKIDQYKQTIWKFTFSEFVVFLSQVVVFFMVAVFTSNCLSNEKKLLSLSTQKINDGSLIDLMLTFLAISIVIGFFSALWRVFDNKYIEYYVNEVLCEMPKTIYAFGSAATGVMLALSLFAHLHQVEININRFLVITLLFALAIFIFGCALSYAFKRKTHILVKPNESIQPTTDEAAD